MEFQTESSAARAPGGFPTIGRALALAARLREQEERAAAQRRRQMVGAGLAQIALIVVALVLLAGARAALAQQLELAAAARADDLRWSIAGEGADTLSELSWRVRAGGLRARGTLPLPGGLELELGGEYARIGAGDVRDSDYDAPGRREEFSRSESDAGAGDIASASFALGRPLALGRWQLTPRAGVALHRQALQMRRGVQVIPDEGAFSGLDARYTAHWGGWWYGAELARAAGPWRLALRADAHRALYRADARWNLRDDLAQHPSFRHAARGRGLQLAAELGYAPSPRWRIVAAARWGAFKTASGSDEVRFADGARARGRLNGVRWSGRELSISAVRTWGPTGS